MRAANFLDFTFALCGCISLIVVPENWHSHCWTH